MTQDYIDIDDEKELLKNASIAVREVMKRVLQAESDKLYQDKPHIKSDIINIIREVVNETNIDSVV
jgi:uncharacterized protein (DUF2267 family)